MSFNIDFGNFVQPVPSANAPLYASVDGVALALGGDECVFQDRATGEVHVMTLQVLQALDLCREFRTLDEHCATIAQRLGSLAGQADAVRRVVQGLIQRGLVVSDADWLGALVAPQGLVPPPLRAVFVRANGNAGQLDRLLDSLAAYERQFKANRRYVVLDGAAQADSAATAASVRRFAAAAGVRATHVDAHARLAIVERLAAACPASAAPLRATLGGATADAGALQDLAALLGAGARWAILDASALLPLARGTDARPGVDLVDAGHVPIAFFPSADAALGAGAPLARDPFDAHLDLAGHALGDVLARAEHAPTRNSLRGTEPSRSARLSAATRIAATSLGWRGQTATRHVANLFLVDPDARAQFWHDRAQYQRHLDGACVVRAVARARLVAPEQARPFVVDGSVLAAPVAGNVGADALFGVMTRALQADAAIVMTPDTLGRDEGGAHDPDSVRRPDGATLAEFLADYVGVRLVDVRAETPAARARSVASLLADAAQSSPATRTELLDGFVRFRRADLVARLQSVFASAQGAPAWWQSDLHELITANGKALIDGAPSRLAEWPADADAADGARRLGDALGGYAALLAAWPELHGTAAAQMASGQGGALLDA